MSVSGWKQQIATVLLLYQIVMRQSHAVTAALEDR